MHILYIIKSTYLNCTIQYFSINLLLCSYHKSNIHQFHQPPPKLLFLYSHLLVLVPVLNILYSALTLQIYYYIGYNLIKKHTITMNSFFLIKCFQSTMTVRTLSSPRNKIPHPFVVIPYCPHNLWQPLTYFLQL